MRRWRRRQLGGNAHPQRRSRRARPLVHPLSAPTPGSLTRSPGSFANHRDGLEPRTGLSGGRKHHGGKFGGKVWACSPPTNSEAISLARQLAEVLAAAHHLGLAHGQLCPSKVLFLAESTIALDFSGALTGTASSKAQCLELDRACQMPESAQLEALAPARDQFALGVIFLWLAHGEIYRPGRMPPGREPLAPESVTAITSILETLAFELVRTDPTERPDAAEIAGRLREHELPPENPAAGTSRSAASTHPTLDLPGSGAALAATHILDVPPAEAKTALLNDEIVKRGNLGRYRIRHKIGQGGMGQFMKLKTRSTAEQSPSKCCVRIGASVPRHCGVFARRPDF